jgi:hypothetical protein
MENPSIVAVGGVIDTEWDAFLDEKTGGNHRDVPEL